jgi:hypothetical protein
MDSLRNESDSSLSMLLQTVETVASMTPTEVSPELLRRHLVEARDGNLLNVESDGTLNVIRRRWLET